VGSLVPLKAAISITHAAFYKRLTCTDQMERQRDEVVGGEETASEMMDDTTDGG